VFSYKNNTLSKLDLPEIEKIVRNITLENLGKYDTENNSKIDFVRTQMASLRNTIDKFRLLQKTAAHSFSVDNFFKIHPIKCSTEHSITALDYFLGNPNGYSTGNIGLIQACPLRLSDAILRFSCPLASVPEDKKPGLYTTSQKVLCVSELGGTYYVPANIELAGDDTNFLVLEPKESNPEIPLECIIAWFKSSLFTWYVIKEFSTSNIYLPDVMMSLFIPKKRLSSISNELLQRTNTIITLEKKYLDLGNNENSLKKIANELNSSREGAIEKITNDHNKAVTKEMAEIDGLIFAAFNMSDADITNISNDLDAMGIYNFLDE
jgi:hypothetical protein